MLILYCEREIAELDSGLSYAWKESELCKEFKLGCEKVAEAATERVSAHLKWETHRSATAHAVALV